MTSKANYAAPIGSKADSIFFREITIPSSRTWTLDQRFEAKPRALYRCSWRMTTSSDKSYLAYMTFRLGLASAKCFPLGCLARKYGANSDASLKKSACGRRSRCLARIEDSRRLETKAALFSSNSLMERRQSSTDGGSRSMYSSTLWAKSPGTHSSPRMVTIASVFEARGRTGRKSAR